MIRMESNGILQAAAACKQNSLQKIWSVLIQKTDQLLVQFAINGEESDSELMLPDLVCIFVCDHKRCIEIMRFGEGAG